MRPVVIIGAPRSGTNMLRDALTSIPGVGTWPCDEINYLWRHGNRDLPTDELPVEAARPEAVDYMRGQFDRQARRRGVEVLVEKTCANSLRVPFVDRILPDARYVFLVRDGRDAVASAMRRWTGSASLTYLARKARYVPPGDIWHYALRFGRSRSARIRSKERRVSTWGPRFEGIDELAAGESLARVCAVQWATCVTAATRDLAAAAPDRTITVHYEALVARPEVQIGRLLDFLSISANDTDTDRAVQDISGDRVGRWKALLSPADLAEINPAIRPAMAAHGYL